MPGSELHDILTKAPAAIRTNAAKLCYDDCKARERMSLERAERAESLYRSLHDKGNEDYGSF